ncbi:MAG: tripartite tricarboxylate transporter substrate binding protein [Armatimonadota bacterium]|nr:tripartite tricarboxylate transporter substrate binding protein [Armatimonadota bacterium]MDW8155633.1 tripartite tricarboxylate transporter substrate binding protein [Armatimonadota bacterium]
MTKRAALIALFVATLGAGVAYGSAGWRPARPVTVVVPWPAGGSTDMTARILGSQMERFLGQRIVIVNTPGAGGSIGMKEVWDRPRDGYTWAANSSTAVISYPVLGQLDITHRDWLYFYVLYAPNVIAVPANSPYRTLRDLAEAMRARPGAIRVSSAGAGSSGHLGAETFRLAVGVTYRHVPYAGGAPAVIAAVQGEVEAVMQLSMEVAEMLKAGRLRALAVMSRSPLTIEGYGTIPSITQVIPNFPDTGSYFGLMVPKDTPADIVTAIEGAFRPASEAPAVRLFARQNGVVAVSLAGRQATEATEQKARRVAWTLYEAGLAKKSPTELGIPRP